MNLTISIYGHDKDGKQVNEIVEIGAHELSTVIPVSPEFQVVTRIIINKDAPVVYAVARTI